MSDTTVREWLLDLIDEGGDNISENIDGIMRIVTAEKRQLLERLKGIRHLYNIKSTDGILNDANTGILAIPVSAIDLELAALQGDTGAST